eukprot:TRINITY_DN9461_c0_g3_i1.p1 TRINITY_DN9461_c0_g3~~TRINITY_DN9461_c0_g3_i1.p1  ORF type:complete len:556 (-),score=-7.75 TRINITY_DN9461_c0_g3_i1:271-1938(-)
MKTKYLISTLFAAALITAPASRVSADAGDFVAGAIIGGIIGNAAKKNNRTSTKRHSGVPRSQEGRDIQTSLNYFGFNAGSVDGQLGRQSRAAVSRYQAYMGYPATGQLTQFEKDFLISSYYRAQSGGQATTQLVLSTPDGTRGLLTIYRDEQLNGGRGTASIRGHYGLPPVVAQAVNEIAKSSDPSAEQLVQRSGFIQLSDMNGDGQTDYILDTSVTGSAFWCNAQNCAVRVFVSTPEGYVRNDFQAFNVNPAMFSCLRGTCSQVQAPTQLALAPAAPQADQSQLPPVTSVVAPGVGTPVATAQPVVKAAPAAASAAPALPSFLGGAVAAPSLASHCNKVSLLTSSNGGFTTLDTMHDPAFVLSEQLCLARTYAIAQSEEMVSKVQGFTPQQIEAQCEGFGPAMKDHVAALSLKAQPAVQQDVASFILSTGMSPAQLKGTAKICLGVGYSKDNMDVALGSALLLTALGQTVYAELMGHHLAQGFGTAKRTDMAVEWYQQSVQAADNGAELVFAPGQPERTDLIRQVSLQLSGQAQGSAASPIQAVTTLPVFSVDQ